MKSDFSFREFKPALRFLLIFVGAYLVGNIIYGVYVEWYKPAPDPMTVWVTNQAAYALTKLDGPVESVVSAGEPIVLLRDAVQGGDSKTTLRVFEGCNGLNVIIVFVSFIAAFGGRAKQIAIFLLTGFLVIHIANLLRIILLYYTAAYRPLFFYYFHKYFFTAVLYVVVMGLWFVWTQMKSNQRDSVKA